MRWPWQARPLPLAAAPEAGFDAMVDVDPGELPAWVTAEAAVEAASAAVRALAGATVVSVAVRRQTEGVGVRLYRAGASDAPGNEEWGRVRAGVERVVREALRAVRARPGWLTGETTSSAPDGAMAGAPGFAEAMSAVQVDALAELAMLAQSVVQVGAPPPPRPAPRAEANADMTAMARLLAFVLPADGRDTAAAAVRRFGSYAGVLAAPEVELRRVPGLGTHSVAAIKLVHAAAVRLARAEVARAAVLDDPARLMAYLATALARERVEQFRILFLDEHGMLRADEVQASGTVNHTPVYPREVVRRALELRAAAVVLVHNHPSGDPAPSREDIAMTRQVQQAASVMGIVVRDHVIVGNGRWLSFQKAGLLD